MNWIEIEKKYPKASKLKDNWIKKYFYNDGNGHLYRSRDLYDFFDELEIFVHCYNTEISKWYWEIDEYGAECLKDYETRQISEEVAFLKAFEILENEIKINKT